MAARNTNPMAPETIPDRLQLDASVLQRTLHNFEPEKLDVHDGMVALAETLMALSDRLPADNLTAHLSMVQTAERYVQIAALQLALYIQRGYTDHGILRRELSRVVEDLRSIQSCLLHVMVGATHASRCAAA